MAAMNNSARQKYLLQQIESASAIGRVVLLYDACIRFLKDAKFALVRNDKALFCEKLIRAKNIIRELRNSLNLDLDPALAGNMYRLYTYFLKQIIDANRTKNTRPLDFVIGQMMKLNQSWKEAEEKGLAKDVKRYEERLGTEDVNIVRRVKPKMVQAQAERKSGDSLLETLNMKV